MELTLKRTDFTSQSTIGDLYVDGKWNCFILEDIVRAPGVKVKGRTAIPYGRYRVVITFSNRFQRELPLLLDVPMFEGIRIHPGNNANNTEGCLLPGRSKQKDQVLVSKLAFNLLFLLLQDAIKNKEEIWITIEDGREGK